MSSDKSEPVNPYDVFEGIVSVRSVFSGIDKGVCDRKILEILRGKYKGKRQAAWIP